MLSQHQPDIEAGPAADREALLPTQPVEKPGFFSKAWGACKTGGLWTIATITAAPSALNALVNPSGKSPSELGIDWWKGMSNPKRAHSIANSSSSLAINTVMNAVFLPTAWDKFKSSITHLFDSPREFIDNTLSIIIAIGGAVAAAAIAYNAFLWLPYGSMTAAIPAFISFTIMLASRYISIKNIFKRIANLFNRDAHQQLQFADALQHLNENHLEVVNQLLREMMSDLPLEAGKPLSDTDMNTLSKELAGQLTILADAHPDLLKDKSTTEYAAHYAGIIFALSLALIFGTSAFLVYMQKGFDGVNTLASFMPNDSSDSDPASLTDLNVWAKRAIGFLPGIATAFTYADHGSRLLTTAVDLTKHLYSNPKHILPAVLILIANGLAASGPQNVAAGVFKKVDNITGVPPDNKALNTTLEMLNALGGGTVNTISSATRVFLNQNPTQDNITVKDIANYLAKVDNHLGSQDTIHQFGLFLDASHQAKTQAQNLANVPQFANQVFDV